MKTFEELLNTDEPGWAVVQDWLRQATNPVDVLPPVEANRQGIEDMRKGDIRRCTRDLLLVERARDWLLEEESGGA